MSEPLTGEKENIGVTTVTVPPRKNSQCTEWVKCSTPATPTPASCKKASWKPHQQTMEIVVDTVDAVDAVVSL